MKDDMYLFIFSQKYQNIGKILVQIALIMGQFWTILKLTPKSALLVRYKMLALEQVISFLMAIVVSRFKEKWIRTAKNWKSHCQKFCRNYLLSH